MSLNKRLINTGGAASNPYSLENATLLTTYSISGETRPQWKMIEYVADNRVYNQDNAGIIYHYALNGTTQSVWSNDIRRYQGVWNMATTNYGLRFISTPSAGYIYTQGADLNQPSIRRIEQTTVASNGTWFIGSAGQSFTITATLTVPNGYAMSIDFNTDGTKMYVSGLSGFYVYNLSTPYMINTATLFSTSTDSSVINKNIRFTPDGTRLFVKNQTNSYQIFQYDLSTPFDITTKTLTYTANNPQVQAFTGQISFNGDGTRMYLGSYGVQVYSL